jgi:hypothetical protein
MYPWSRHFSASHLDAAAYSASISNCLSFIINAFYTAELRLQLGLLSEKNSNASMTLARPSLKASVIKLPWHGVLTPMPSPKLEHAADLGSHFIWQHPHQPDDDSSALIHIFFFTHRKIKNNFNTTLWFLMPFPLFTFFSVSAIYHFSNLTHLV